MPKMKKKYKNIQKMQKKTQKWQVKYRKERDEGTFGQMREYGAHVQ